MTAPLYNSAEHESLCAIMRSLLVNFGQLRAADELLRFMGVASAYHLSPFGANYCRKHLEKLLPDCVA